MFKYFIFILILMYSINTYAISKIDGNNIILLTASEREKYSDNEEYYNQLTNDRAIKFCKNIGKKLSTYEFEDVALENYYGNDKNNKSYQIITNSVIPIGNGFRKASKEELLTHYHDGGVAVSILTLGFVPIIIQYKTRIVTNIDCDNNYKYRLE